MLILENKIVIRYNLIGFNFVGVNVKNIYNL